MHNLIPVSLSAVADAGRRSNLARPKLFDHTVQMEMYETEAGRRGYKAASESQKGA